MTNPITWTNITVKLSQLIPWDGNPKTSTAKNVQQLQTSRDELGQFQDVAIGPFNDSGMAIVYDGHQRLSAWKIDKGLSFEVTAKQSSRYLDDEEQRKISWYSRQIGAWDWDKLANWPAVELMEWGADTALLTDWRRDVAALGDFVESNEEPEESQGAEPKTNRAEELREEWGVELGQMWRLPSRVEGQEHRLICGDCTEGGVVDRVCNIYLFLMVTDPPYGVEYNADWRNDLFGKGDRVIGRVENDSVIDWKLAFSLFSGDVVYCWHNPAFASKVELSLEVNKIITRSHIIWNKPHFVVSRGHYHARHEACWYSVRKGKQSNWCGPANEQTVWDIALDERAEGGHSTQKPLECMARPIRNHKGDVYEPFSGSGTTIIAAENLSRQCRAVEISPNYVAVTLQRYKDTFGITAELAD